MSSKPSSFTQWTPVRSRYMERFKDRAWRLFGAKVPISMRPIIKARFESRREKWIKQRIGGLIGITLRSYEKEFVASFTQDFILMKVLE